MKENKLTVKAVIATVVLGLLSGASVIAGRESAEIAVKKLYSAKEKNAA